MGWFRHISCFALLLAAPFVGDIAARAEELPASVVAAFKVKAAQIPTAWKGYYEERLTEPSEDGALGAHQYFRGKLGTGAILWSAIGGAHLVFGEALAWRNHNRDQWVYPLADPLEGPSTNCDLFCPARDTIMRQQFSWNGFTGFAWVCVGPNGAHRSHGALAL